MEYPLMIMDEDAGEVKQFLPLVSRGAEHDARRD